MPREIVTPHCDDHPIISVGWERTGGDIQIGLEQRSGHLLDAWYGPQAVRARIGRELVARLNPGSELEKARRVVDEAATSDTLELAYAHIGQQVLDVVVGSSSEVGTSWFTHLERFGANRLVRLVRTGRDGAFGRDE